MWFFSKNRGWRGPSFTGATLLILCFEIHCNSSSHPESIVSEGMKIIASTPEGEIIIDGRKGFTRSYSGVGWSKIVDLIPRGSRWNGSLGLYHPGGSSFLGDRLIIEEGRQFFANESEVLRFIQSLSGYYGKITYTNNGLIVAYKVIPIPGEKPTVSLSIWQVYINGDRPNVLRGGVDNKIRIIGGEIPEKALPLPASVGYPRVLSDKEYPG